IVTGAGSGMGLAIARGLLAAGARVTMIDLKKERPPDLPVDRALYLNGDVTDDKFVATAAAHAFHETGRIDYLVNAAGVLWFGRDKSLVEMDLETWDQVLAIDLKSMVITVRHAVPLMKQGGGGAMVHFSSVQCLRGDDKPQDAYQAAKAGMLALSKSIAIQFARDGIRSNCILPGPVDSPMQDRWRDNPAQKKAVAEAVPLGRIGVPQDIADACLFLLSDKASYITGTELIVDGGLMARP
ncbi:MAG: SDR family NAD(P)-dependent oxidoreductase, partial [Dongiaceae bacterium]